MGDESEFLSERSGALLRLTINRPEAANAINDKVTAGLLAGLAEASADDTIKVVILTGSGSRVFSAGRDLKNPHSLSVDALNQQRREESRAYNGALMAFDKPLVVAMNGTAMGAGLMLVMHADQVVAVEDAEISLPEVNIGIVSFLAHTLVAVNGGHGIANDLVLTGRHMGAAEGLQRGLIHAVVSREKLIKEAELRASALAAKPIATFREMKAWILARRRAAVEAAYRAHDALDARKLG
jgi:enoyl-CoA hydratase/carnithine racemase